MTVKFSNFTDSQILQKLNSLTLEDFTVQEQKDFENFLKNLHNCEGVKIREWVPWWKNYEEIGLDGEVLTDGPTTLVEEVSAEDEEEIKALQGVNLNRFVLYDAEETEGEGTEEAEGEGDDQEMPDIDENPIAHAFKTVLDELDTKEPQTEDEDEKITVQIDKNRESKTSSTTDLITYTFTYKDKSRCLKSRFRSIKPLTSLTSKAPSPLLKYHILNTLYPFLFYYRLHNGEILKNPPIFDFDNLSTSQDPNLLYDKGFDLFRTGVKFSVELAIEKL